MKIDVNQLCEYYTKADIFFNDVVSMQIPSGSIAKNWKTSKKSGGLVIPLGGSACYTCEESAYNICPGMVIHAGPDILLDKEVTGSNKWHYAVIHYQIPETQFDSLPYYNSHFHIPIGINPKLTEILGKLTDSYSSSGSMSVLRCRTLFHNLIEEIVLSADRQSRKSPCAIMENAAEYMKDNCSNRFSIDNLAGQFGMDGKRFSEQFQKYMGMTPVRYLTELRIARAKELLTSCDCLIKQIASCVGYEDPYYFSRIFKKITGVSPSEYQTEKKIHH